MCGIAGVVALDDVDPPSGTAAAMCSRLLHRGPDGTGRYAAAGVELGACRLAIVDLDPRGRMPMATPDGRFHIVYNGEIYNRPALRDDLLRSGTSLRTTTDTEVLLHLYAREGAAMLTRLDGMFAFAIWDAERRELFAARDRCGEKPFFYSTRAGYLYFASEPKALFAAGVPCAFDAATWPELLTFRLVAGSRTPYRGVRRLLPGHWLRAGRRGVDTGEWWRFDGNGGAAEPASLLSLLEASIQRRLVADVPVGVLLSGGLDSSSVTALAAALSPRPLPAFTVRYADQRADEGDFADAVARQSGVEHHEVRVGADDLPALLAQAAWHEDEPMAFAAAPDLLAVSRYARRHVRVILTGESADELFGGYDRFRIYRHPRLVRLAGRALRPLRDRLARDGRARRAIDASGLDAAAWVARVNADRDPALASAAPFAAWAPYRAAVAAAAVADHRETVRQALAYEHRTHLQGVLDHCDRQTMGASIEARIPFLDPDILRLAAGVPTRALFRGAHGKRVLREAMAGRLPDAVRTRRKQGWVSPYWGYLRSVPELRAWMARAADHELLGGSPLGATAAREVIARFLAGDAASARLAWLLGRIVLWHQVCVENERDPFRTPNARVVVSPAGAA